ncbi:MAG: hypothetical protein UX47_C0007G0090 [Candidatus Collierbacteria bacterium GW2011_GWA2_46_26]|uniref:Uncharacterized protein n=1 Tax=Candidatus Collierbacteria bacterium GW2011_GWA2_46_26 TaxID=1618381 RepID=A0A0G1PJC2_9BACT|nr:MAG: hypothetical protein UW29_C0006G0060 [Candidatus Collierbacteria bacterium GW2011_GWC2_44_13]KKU32846.1 MAG: hypothetical protein UX47_C0007G0090 [Candidatus Collierbacteria bacterium GW2011_GWA2_46_26]
MKKIVKVALYDAFMLLATCMLLSFSVVPILLVVNSLTGIAFSSLLLGFVAAVGFACVLKFVTTLVGTWVRINQVLDLYAIEYTEAVKMVCVHKYKSRQKPIEWDTKSFYRDLNDYRARKKL